MDQQMHPERKEQGQPRIITAGKGRTGRYRHQQNQFFGSHGGKPQGGGKSRRNAGACGGRAAENAAPATPGCGEATAEERAPPRRREAGTSRAATTTATREGARRLPYGFIF